MRVFVTTVEYNNGVDVYVNRTQAGATKVLVNISLENWSQRFGDQDPPANDADLIRRVFDTDQLGQDLFYETTEFSDESTGSPIGD